MINAGYEVDEIVSVPGKGEDFCGRVNFKPNITQSMKGRSTSKYIEVYLISDSSRFFKFKGIVKVECTDASPHAMKLRSFLSLVQIIIIIIIIIIFINCNWVVTRWQWLFYMYTNMKKKVTRKFKSGGLHERHVVVTWKLGNHLSVVFDVHTHLSVHL